MMAYHRTEGFSSNGQSLYIGAMASVVAARLAEWDRLDVVARIWRRDHTVWTPTPVPELTDRLGWLDLPSTMTAAIEPLHRFASDTRRDGYRHAVLLGMGGSSLAPELIQATFGKRENHPALLVLDTTHPDAVLRMRALIDPRSTLFIVSSKSGTTIETQSGFQFAWAETMAAGEEAGPHFVAITDPGTPLERLARQRGFRAVWAAPPDVGGRYSALTVFGMVPAAIIGAPIEAVLASSRAMAERCGPSVSASCNPGVQLGVCLGEMARAGRDKLVLLASPGLAAFPAWLEQLIAESTGKHGTGIVPIVDEPPMPGAPAGRDRVFVLLTLAGEPDPAGADQLGRLRSEGHPVITIALTDRASLGGEFFRWELATAAAGAVLGVQPFDQPDVQLAKELARRAMTDLQARGDRPGEVVGAEVSAPGTRDLFARWLATVSQGDYISVQAFLACDALLDRALRQLRRALARRTEAATTLGYGPRFLHSTGQLHKGGPATAVCLQLADTPSHDVAVPGAPYTFGQLVRGQGLGDYEALRQRARRVVRLELGSGPQTGIEQILDWIG